MPEEACGVFAVLKPKGENVVLTVKQGLEALQHRGQDSAGMTALKEEGLLTRRVMGLVENLNPHLGELKSHAIIGQVRYPTTGSSRVENAQPIQFKNFSVAFNGNISNYDELRKKLEGEGAKFSSDVDIEVIGQLVQKSLKKQKLAFWRGEEKKIAKALQYSMKELRGSYSIVLLTKNGHLFAARDPFAYKPLVFSRHGEGWIISSETHAFNKIGVTEEVQEVKPGEILSFSTDGVKKFIGMKSEKLAHCAFEWVYFAHRTSVLNGVKVINARRNLGQLLSGLLKRKGVEGDIVIPVPNSGIQCAHGIAAGLNIPLLEAIKKTGKVGAARSFLAATQEKREELARIKYELPDPELVRGKRVVLVDDSIVRGTSMPVLVRLLKEAGAAEVHIAVSAPEIKSPCFMGINFPTTEELAASGKTTAEVLNKINDAIVGEKLVGKVVKGDELRSVLKQAGIEKVKKLKKELGADSLIYTNITDLIKAIGLPGKLCLACFTGMYPEEKRRPLQALERVQKKISGKKK